MKPFMRSGRWTVGVLAGIFALACEDEETHRMDPPLSDLAVAWDQGFIEGDLFPIHPPDPVRCNAWLVLENLNAQKAFSLVEVPTADVMLAADGSAIGTIPLETDWDGGLGPGEVDTVLFFKETGSVRLFDLPCDERVFLDFLIRNADGESKVFRPDTLTFTCSSLLRLRPAIPRDRPSDNGAIIQTIPRNRLKRQRRSHT